MEARTIIKTLKQKSGALFQDSQVLFAYLYGSFAKGVCRGQIVTEFRNRLVHLYGDIDDAAVHAFLRHDLNEVTLFKNTIINRYLKQ